MYIDKSNTIRFTDKDIPLYTHTDKQDVKINYDLIYKVHNKRIELNKPIHVNKRMKYECWNDMFVFKENENESEWYYIQVGYWDFWRDSDDKYKKMLLMHNKIGSSWWADEEFMRERGVKFDTLTKNIPQEFNNKKCLNMIEEIKKHNYQLFIFDRENNKQIFYDEKLEPHNFEYPPKIVIKEKNK